MTWEQVPLGDIVTLKRGYDLPSRARKSGPFAVVSSSGITGTHVEPKVQSPGVVTGRYGTLGQVFYLERPFWPLNTTLYVEDFKGNDPRWVSCLLRTLAFEGRSGAAAVPGVNRNALHLLPAPRPPLRTQRKIASVLAGYDELITNKLRRLEILEEIARTVYWEWFVHGAKRGDWTRTTVGAAFDVLGGGTPSTQMSAYWDGHINWYTPKDLTTHGHTFIEQSARQITEVGLNHSSAKLFPPGCVMMTSRATLGVVAINSTPASTNQGFITCIPNRRVSNYYIYFWIKANLDTIVNHASGATFKEISKSAFRNLEIALPDEQEMVDFTSLVDPSMRLVATLGKQARILTVTRDLLLPKLVSGEIDVSQLDIDTSWLPA